MGFRLQRRISLGKFIQLNISKSGVGVSAGVPGLRISRGPSGTFFTAGLPGTGLSYRKKIGSKSTNTSKAKAKEEAAAQTESDEVPQPGFFAAGHEKALARGLEAYYDDKTNEALEYFLEAGSSEPGATILAAAILAEEDDSRIHQGIELLEEVIQGEDEFPTPLMEKYLAETDVEIQITPNVTAVVPVDGLAATLLLVELYQKQRRVREAIALLEEVEELAQEPTLTLSLCELYATRELWDNIIERASQIESEDDISLETAIFYGRALQEKGLDEAALSVFTKALRRTKDRNPALLTEARYWRAISYQTQGKHQRANSEFQKVYAENPDFRDVAARLEDFATQWGD
jgi:tetratricopeptide (TPR) repeat protein